MRARAGRPADGACQDRGDARTNARAGAWCTGFQRHGNRVARAGRDRSARIQVGEGGRPGEVDLGKSLGGSVVQGAKAVVGWRTTDTSGNNSAENLITVCVACHTALHRE